MNVLTAACGALPALERSAATRRVARSAPIRSKLARAAVSSSSAASWSPYQLGVRAGEEFARLRRLVRDVDLGPQADPTSEFSDRVVGSRLRQRKSSAGHDRGGAHRGRIKRLREPLEFLERGTRQLGVACGDGYLDGRWKQQPAALARQSVLVCQR
jgi:hypothetical protein